MARQSGKGTEDRRNDSQEEDADSATRKVMLKDEEGMEETGIFRGSLW